MTELNSEFIWERHEVNHEFFMEALVSLAEASKLMVKQGYIEEAMKHGSTAFELAWTITRPEAYVLVCDASKVLHEPELVELGSLEHGFRFAYLVVWCKDFQNPLIGHTVFTNEPGVHSKPIDVKDLPSNLVDALKRRFTEVEQTCPVDRTSVESLDEFFAKKSEANLEKEIDDFRAELDELFETWGGGDDSG